MPAHLLVKKQDLNSTRVESADAATPGSGEIVMRVDRFALTANNITYGVAGDMIGYWQFFPAAQGWGRIPVWGIGTVTASNQPSVEVGQRFYGYFPMSNELVVKPEKVNERGFVDAATHRAELPSVYNQYSLVTAGNGFAPDLDNHAMLYRPLFTTSFVLDDFFADNDFFQAQQIILGSASSKTAIGLAFMLQKRHGLKVVGLTSPNNREFTQGLGLYDEVLTYSEVGQLTKQGSAYIDMAGNRDVLSQIHHHLNDDLLYSCGVGITHWEARDGVDPATLPGAKPAMFFAPSQIVKRNKEQGPAQYQQQIAAATADFLSQVDAWVQVVEHPFSEVEDVYRQVLGGPAPDKGHVVLC